MATQRYTCGYCGAQFERKKLQSRLGRVSVYCTNLHMRLAFAKRASARRKLKGLSGSYKDSGKLWRVLRNLARDERGRKCQLCGWGRDECDTAHIVDDAKGGSMTLDNVVVLCPNEHRLFDHGGLTESELETIVISMASFGYAVDINNLRK